MADPSESVEALKAKIAELEAKIATLEAEIAGDTPAPPPDDNDDRS